MDRNQEFSAKCTRLRGAMADAGVAACRLDLQANHAWLGCGADTHIVYASVTGSGTLVVTADRVYVVSDNIESARLMEEEFAGLPIAPVSYPWPEGGAAHDKAIREIVGSGNVGADTPITGTYDMSSALMHCRASLLPPEVERYRRLGAETVRALSAACRAIRPGMTEHGTAAQLAERIVAAGMVPNLILVAADERIARYRHPIPTERKVRRCAMVVVCARRHGLIANATRLVHFGPVPADLRKKHEAVCAVDAELILATTPGRSYGEILRRGLETYRASGFADEWRLHHQGGPTGYMGREFKAVPDSQDTVVPNQAVAWNPSITGTKSEDTFIATAEGPEIVTAARLWPMREVSRPAGTLQRPDILVL